MSRWPTSAFSVAAWLVKVVSHKRGNTVSGRGRVRLPPSKHRLKCPACGFTHTVSIHWRRPKPGETKEAELRL